MISHYLISAIFGQVFGSFGGGRHGGDQGSLPPAVEGVPPGHNLSAIEGGVRQVHAAKEGVRRAKRRGETAVLRLDAGAAGGELGDGTDEDEAGGSLRAGCAELGVCS